jgi:hypothetical protein
MKICRGKGVSQDYTHYMIYDAQLPNVKSSAPDAVAGDAAAVLSTVPATVSTVWLLPLSGASAIGPLPPLNSNSWLLVTSPPPSARPPHEKRMTWSPAARRGSKLHAVSMCKVRSERKGSLEAALGESADDERRARDVVVLAGGDDVELLVGRAVAGRDLDRDEVLTEVALDPRQPASSDSRARERGSRWSGRCSGSGRRSS